MHERALIGYLRGVWHIDQDDPSTDTQVPKLVLLVRTDRGHVVQSGLKTQFSETFLAGQLELR